MTQYHDETEERYCDKCGETHAFKCPRNDAKRREQNRRAQARRRARMKAEAEANPTDARTVRNLRAEIERLEREKAVLMRRLDVRGRRIAELEAELKRSGGGGRADAYREFLGVSNGADVSRQWKRTIAVLHPDRHDGHNVAARLSKFANVARDALTS